MPVSRRSLALPLAALALAAGCTSGSPDATAGPPSPAPSAPADAGAPGEGPPARAEATPAWDTSPSSLAAIGDSITRAFDACAALADCPEASWATGTDAAVDSLARQLLGDAGAVARHTWNLAESGARVAELPEQARRAVAHDPQLVTVLIGANDACAADVGSMTSTAEFEAHFTETMEVIRAHSPRTQVYVASVPDLMRLWQEGSGSPLARSVWRLAQVCPSMLRDAQDRSAPAAERREEVRERVRGYNEVLAEVCAADELCRHDDGAVFGFAFSSRHLSDWDWFHPSRQGQATLASLAYERITAAAG